MYVLRNTEELPRNNYCSTRVCPGVWACAIAYLRVALLIQHANAHALYRDVIYGPSGSTLFFGIIS